MPTWCSRPGRPCRPDRRTSIALALRVGARIFVADDVMDEAGIDEPEEREEEVEKFREFLDQVTAEDFGPDET